MSSRPDTRGLCLAAHSYTGLAPGPRLIVIGAVHGNETCGTQAIRRTLAEFEAGRLAITRGSVTFVPVANPLAYRLRRRDGERNLNRCLFPHADPHDFEDHVANWLCPLLARHDVLLDLHSFHTAGEPFVMLGPTDNTGALEPFARAAEERALARHLGVRRFVDGWLDTYARGVARRAADAATASKALETDPRYGIGTTEYMRSVGGYGVTLECGQHDEAAAPELAWRAIRAALAFLRLSDDVPVPEPVTDPQGLRLVEVVDKHDAADTFVREWPSFTPLAAGEPIGIRADGTPVRAPADCFIVFPNPAAAAGQEWFYLARRCEMF
jgi:succinylglutamate desuccinylase